jgi:DNA-binding CsgD family transcriptional regulator
LRHDSERVGQRIGVIHAEVGEAMSAMLRGTTQPLLDKVIEAVEKMDTIPLAFDAARLRMEIARRHVELGDRESAIRQLNHAFETLSRLGAANELERAKAQLRELDVRPRSPRMSTGAALLSPREKEILRLVLQHKSNKEIATVLGCAHRNVGKHLENACRKLDSHNRHEAAERARMSELI